MSENVLNIEKANLHWLAAEGLPTNFVSKCIANDVDEIGEIYFGGRANFNGGGTEFKSKSKVEGITSTMNYDNYNGIFNPNKEAADAG